MPASDREQLIIKINGVDLEQGGEPTSCQRQIANKRVSRHPEIVFTWSELTVRKGMWAQNVRRSAAEDKILKNFSGSISSGEIVAIMGGSGHGKSTLLNALCGRNLGNLRVDPRGKISLNGERLWNSAETRRIIAYVQQTDIFREECSVREYLEFVASMLMGGSHHCGCVRAARVEEVIQELELQKCAENRIGRISGGEKRRLSIGCKILTNPPILFLDEPTSGLDSESADKVISILERMAKEQNMIVGLTIHQPSRELFEKFDKLYLLDNGNLAFFGTLENAETFFRTRGHKLPENKNPAVFYFEAMAILRKNIPNGTSWHMGEPPVDHNIANHRNIIPFVPNNDVKSAGWKDQFRALFCLQFGSLWMLLLTIFLSTSLIAVLLGSICFQDEIEQDNVKNFNGLNYMAVVTMDFMFQFFAMTLTCQQIPVFFREQADNLYWAHIYYFAKNLSEFLILALPQWCFATILYAMAEPKWHFDQYAVLVGCCMATANVAYSAATTFSYIMGTTTLTSCALPIVGIPLLTFAGIFFNQKTLHSPIFTWLHKLSYVGHAYEIVSVSKWEPIKYIPGCPDSSEVAANYSVYRQSPIGCYRSGHDVLVSMDFSADNLNFDWLMLGAVILGYRVVALLVVLIRALFFN